MELSEFNAEPEQNNLVSGEYNHLQMIFYKLKQKYVRTISSIPFSPMSSQVGIAVGLFVGLLYQLGTLRVIPDDRVTRVCTLGYHKPWYGIVLLIQYVPWSTDRSISF
jgi:hypothetical protein